MGALISAGYFYVHNHDVIFERHACPRLFRLQAAPRMSALGHKQTLVQNVMSAKCQKRTSAKSHFLILERIRATRTRIGAATSETTPFTHRPDGLGGAKRKLYPLILTAGSQTVYLKRLQGMVIHSRHGARDGYTFNKLSALRSGD